MRSIEMVGNDVVALAQGAVATNLVKALEFAAQQIERSPDGYEARLLEFGRAGDSLLWLHATHDDRYIAIRAEPHEVSIGETIESVLAKTALRREAQRRMADTVADGDESGG